MAYNNYLIKIGDTYEIPMGQIVASTYKVTYSTLDLDSYRDANGYLHRNALRRVPSVEVHLKATNNVDLADIFANIAALYTNQLEKKVTASVFIPEINDYYTGDFYVPDIDFTIQSIIDSKINYEETTFKIIGY